MCVCVCVALKSATSEGLKAQVNISMHGREVRISVICKREEKSEEQPYTLETGREHAIRRRPETTRGHNGARQ